MTSEMTNERLAAELRDWARARGYCNARRVEQGKDPLDSDLLIEAADRLEKIARRLSQENKTAVDGQLIVQDDVHVRDVARQIIADAKREWGSGWRRLAAEQRKGVLAIGVIRVVLAQSQQYADSLGFLQSVAISTYTLEDV